MTTNVINRLKLGEVIRGTKGRFFGVTFIKKSGEVRKMTAKVGIKLNRPAKRRSADTDQSPYILVTDMQLWSTGRTAGLSGDALLKHSYRLLNLKSISEFRYQGKVYHIS
jgi:hypothetical protein